MRKEGWELRLSEYIQSRVNTPFQWGEHDCSLFVLDCADVQLGSSYADDWRGSYSTAIGAKRKLTENGDYEGILDSYGFVKKPVALAQRGDLAFMDGDMAMGIVVGDTVVSTGMDGLVSLPITNAIHVWGLPCHQ